MSNPNPVWMQSINAAAAVAARAFTRAATEAAASCPDAVVGASRAAPFAVHLLVDAAPARGVPTPVAAPRVGPIPARAGPRSAPGVPAAYRSPVRPVNARVRRQMIRKRRQPLNLDCGSWSSTRTKQVALAHASWRTWHLRPRGTPYVRRCSASNTVGRPQQSRGGFSTGTVCAAVNNSSWQSGFTFGSAC